MPLDRMGRAIANGRDEGVTNLLFNDSPEAHGHGKILGVGMFGRRHPVPSCNAIEGHRYPKHSGKH